MPTYRFYNKRTKKEYTDLMSISEMEEFIKKKHIKILPPTQAMPDDVKNEDSIIAYRDYYVKYKKDFATWKTSIPEWYSEGINNANL